MDYLVIFVTVLFALLAVASRDSTKSSFYFLLTSSGVSVSLYRMGLVEFALLLLFMSSFSLTLYFLVGLFFSRESEVEIACNKKNGLMMGALYLFIFLGVSSIFFISTSKSPIVPLKEINIVSYLQADFIQNIPLLFTFGVLLISSLVAVLFFVMPASQQDQETL